MIRVKPMSILVKSRARRFYTDVLGCSIKHDIPIGEAAWLTLLAPG